MSKSPRVFNSLEALQSELRAVRSKDKRVAVVPTMGNLHAGHLSLAKAASEECDYLLATIFVNPMQFGPKEDFDRYPRTFSDDIKALEKVACDAVFLPSAQDIYPEGIRSHTLISVPELSTLHCGASRPGHFDGVCTIVCKLFNMIQPDLAVFGLKDYQQFRILSKMVADLQLPVKLLGLPTIRDAGGLAMSSRNSFLSAKEKDIARNLYLTLKQTAEKIKQGQTNFAVLEQEAHNMLENCGLSPEYFHICNHLSLQPAAPDEKNPVILAAAKVGSTRLIDNIQI